MNARPDAASLPIRLADYRAPAWRVERVELDFELGIATTEVGARLLLRRDPAQDEPLRLDGEDLELLSISLDGQPLAPDTWRLVDGGLEVRGARDGSVLETRVRVHPAANTALEGLYLSGPAETGFLLTQCEAQGFRHITFFPDRPDVQAIYVVTLRADRARFPVLLAGGNPDGAGELDGGRHWARFVDPHPKPAYLFALVAGRLEKIEQDYRTADGRDVQLKIWAEADAIDCCHYAMDALVRSMRWDEQAYGRNYDLDVFHVVATHDFNMGAMENKGLNIFNTKCLLADADSSTDDEYRRVEAVVAHEYFHNWSGNRVTCRDWFQLSLKEGFTVYREQCFSADMNSAPLKRIEDVALLRRAQFPEDAGPLAHPVRPAEYREINNFYTATVYEKGAELVRMLAGKLGAEGFRRGTDLYFSRNDGRAATIEDFLAALGEANHADLTPYLAWYGQSGTPRLKARGEYDAARREYALTLSQHTPASHQQPLKQLLPIPVKLALFDADGRMLPLHLDGQVANGETELVVVLDHAEQRFVFHDVAERPVPSLLRGFSAPAVLECDYTPAELALLLGHDPDGFNRWEAGQQLALRACDALRDGADNGAVDAWCDALAALFDDARLDAALLADLLVPPGEIELAEREPVVDPARIHALRQQLQQRLAARIGVDKLETRYRALAAQSTAGIDAISQGHRSLKQRVLQLLALLAPATACQHAAAQYRDAPSMTDRLAALGVLARHDAARSAEPLAHYRERYANDPLALDKWFALQAQLPGAGALARVQALEADPAFTLKNPNRARALLGTWANGNPSGFHRADGAGYRLYAERLLALDALNPQIAARLATAFNGWQRLEPRRREAAHAALASLAARGTLSRNLAEIVGNMLKG
ncbi:aminopeptidase N [Rhodanobacter sp. DHB23]|uniref:aminopeptidase N n=1 Tax=Rhodanobacter sp. DHB23 TaxID=2775923 RepID=UPI0017857966|nr:aminopeptidase N [Rhodanobacter sp. DHB23]MBD8872621.1 aminopeptidase N [Rhodanobacter sp. DHB23]